MNIIDHQKPGRAAFSFNAIIMPLWESDGAPTPRRKLNGSSRSTTYGISSSTFAPHNTHRLRASTFKQNQQQAAPSRTAQELSACTWSALDLQS